MKPEEVRNSDDMRAVIESRDVEFVTVAIPDLQGLLRGKYMSRGKFLGALESGYGVPAVVFALDPAFPTMAAASPMASPGFCPKPCAKFPGSGPTATSSCWPK